MPKVDIFLKRLKPDKVGAVLVFSGRGNIRGGSRLRQSNYIT